MKKRNWIALVVVAVAAAAVWSFAAPDAQAGRGNGPVGTVYVISQDLYYDTFVSAERLPPKGPFQLIQDTNGDGIGETMYGPGQPGYLGGRWKQPDGKGGYNYFLCPLLGPGREEP